jgi:hypothetical protein
MREVFFRCRIGSFIRWVIGSPILLPLLAVCHPPQALANLNFWCIFLVGPASWSRRVGKIRESGFMATCEKCGENCETDIFQYWIGIVQTRDVSGFHWGTSHGSTTEWTYSVSGQPRMINVCKPCQNDYFRQRKKHFKILLAIFFLIWAISWMAPLIAIATSFMFACFLLAYVLDQRGRKYEITTWILGLVRGQLSRNEFAGRNIIISRKGMKESLSEGDVLLFRQSALGDGYADELQGRR